MNAPVHIEEMLALSLACDVRQPLGASLINAHAALRLLDAPHPDLAEIRALLEDLRRDLLAGAQERMMLERRLAALTTREREVFLLVVQGHLNKVVGMRLGVAEKTVKVHRGRVMEKMQAGSLAELARMAERLGLAMEEDP
jgi:FixJ family two-component response regulator